jgi:hypothetical protein
MRPLLIFAVSMLTATSTPHVDAQAQAPARSDWMRPAGWGVMVHYLADWQWKAEAKAKGWPEEDWKRLAGSEAWNALVDGFDVEGLAKQLQSARVPYVFITIGQGSGFYCAPNAEYDAITGIRPSRCSRRDLVADLYEALHPRGIRLLVYAPGGPAGADEDVSRAFDGYKYGPQSNPAAAAKWERVMREWSERWGKKVEGWWIDGCHWPNLRLRGAPPNFESLATALRAGNPQGVVAFNSGLTIPVVSVTPHEDYTAGVTIDPAALLASSLRAVDGRTDGAQLHMVSYLGRTWGFGPPKELPEQVAAWTRKLQLQGGVATWDVPLTREGRLDEAFLPHLRALAGAP